MKIFRSNDTPNVVLTPETLDDENTLQVIIDFINKWENCSVMINGNNPEFIRGVMQEKLKHAADKVIVDEDETKFMIMITAIEMGFRCAERNMNLEATKEYAKRIWKSESEQEKCCTLCGFTGGNHFKQCPHYEGF